MSLVSVIIPTYNRAKWLREAIESVRDQTFTDWELIVVDDGSSDNTAEVCGQYAFCRYLWQENSGVSAARNAGMAAANGLLLAFLDNDDRWLPGKLERQVEFLEDRKDVVLTYTGLHWFDEQDGRIRGSYNPPEELDAHKILHDWFVPNSSSVIRRSVISKVGLWDTRFALAQDRDYFLRLALQGAVGGMSDVLTEIRHHNSHLSGNKARWFREAKKLLHKHRHMHTKCHECKRVFQRAGRGIRHAYAEILKQQSREALAEQNYWRLCSSLCRSLWYDPTPLSKRLGVSAK